MRSFIDEDDSPATAEERCLTCPHECAPYGGVRALDLLLDPVNRYEISYVNTVPEALHVSQRAGRPDVKVTPGVLEMKIEDLSMMGSLRQAGDAIGYVHLADSNRRAPGCGHLDVPQIGSTLQEIGYNGHVTAETLPYPNPGSAAAAMGYVCGLCGAQP